MLIHTQKHTNGKYWKQEKDGLKDLLVSWESHRQMQLFQEGKDGVEQGRANRKGSIYKDTRYERVSDTPES